MLTRDRIRRYPLILFVVTVGLYLTGLARSRGWVEPNGQIVGRDYLAFYMAGDMVNRGQAEQLYQPAAQSEYQKRFMASISPGWSGTCLYLNPPHYAWAMSFLARLGYGASLIVWWVLSAGCFVATVVLWRRWLSPSPWGTVVLLAVCMPAWFQAFAGGQNSFFSLLILTAFCGLLMTGRDFAAGLVLSLLAYKFQFLILPSVLLLCTRRWRAVAGLALGGAAALVLTAGVLGLQSVHNYVTFGLQLDRLMAVEGFDVYKQQSWYGCLTLLGKGWLSPSIVGTLKTLACFATLYPLGVVWRSRWSPGSPQFALQLSALMVATLLTSPHLFHYDMLLATLPAVLWWRATRDPDIGSATTGVRIVLAAGFAWLAISGPVAEVAHVQLSAPLLFAWLVLVSRVLSPAAANSTLSATPATVPCPAASRPAG